MPQRQSGPELQGPFTNEFEGLSLANKGGGLPPGQCPVFHNCDISSDGAVVRRGGTNLIASFAPPATYTWVQSVRTRQGAEFLVCVNSSGVTVHLMELNRGVLEPKYTFTKTGVWTRALIDVNFLVVNTPFDRVLIFTGNHPPIQISLLERVADLTCTVVNQRVSTPTTPSDSNMWLDTGLNTTVLRGPDEFGVQTFYPPSVNRPGFDFNLSGLTMLVNEVRRYTITQVSLQWWAESIVWEGKDFVSGVTRANVVPTDQNVKIPISVTTDLDVRYKDSPFRGISVSETGNILTFPTKYYQPVAVPTGATQWAHGNGVRHDGVSGNTLVHTPFFCTWGSTTGVTTDLTPNNFWRSRELRFNAGAGATPSNLDVFMDDKPRTIRTSFSTSFTTGDCITYTTDLTGTVRTDTISTGGVANNIIPIANGNVVPSSSVFVITNKEVKWVGAIGRNVWYRNLGVAGGTIDGTYVQAFGLGSFSDYARGSFPSIGCIYKDRLVLKLPADTADQLILSGTSDVEVPGEFYSFFQVTDALTGSVDDPFTVNVAFKSREQITAMLAWQQSLFVFTSTSTYNISSGEVFGPDAFGLSLVASYGAFNHRCVAATSLTVLFMNRFGVFDLLNKSNTSDYGAFERSSKIRPIFSDYKVTPDQERQPWLSLNDSSNKVYMGLPVQNEKSTCTVLLSLNLAWDSWSTLASAFPFTSVSCTQVGNYSVMSTYAEQGGYTHILQLDATHYIDYFKQLGVLLPYSGKYPYPGFFLQSDNNRIYPVSHPVMPLLSEFYSVGGSKVGTTYQSDAPNVVRQINGSSYIDATLLPQLSRYSGGILATLATDGTDAQIFSPSTWSGNDVTISTIPSGDTFLSNLGTVYPSFFASPSFNLMSLGRLKRLKRLHLLFDTSVVTLSSYPNSTNKPMNSAIVMVDYNYNETTSIADASLVSGNTRYDTLVLDSSPASRGVEQLSLPLQGYGCDYQFYVVSVGVDAFKVLGYEFEVTPQRRKTYNSTPAT